MWREGNKCEVLKGNADGWQSWTSPVRHLRSADAGWSWLSSFDWRSSFYHTQRDWESACALSLAYISSILLWQSNSSQSTQNSASNGAPKRRPLENRSPLVGWTVCGWTIWTSSRHNFCDSLQLDLVSCFFLMVFELQPQVRFFPIHCSLTGSLFNLVATAFFFWSMISFCHDIESVLFILVDKNSNSPSQLLSACVGNRILFSVYPHLRLFGGQVKVRFILCIKRVPYLQRIVGKMPSSRSLFYIPSVTPPGFKLSSPTNSRACFHFLGLILSDLTPLFCPLPAPFQVSISSPRPS